MANHTRLVDDVRRRERQGPASFRAVDHREIQLYGPV
jgi:hypothetical protein